MRTLENKFLKLSFKEHGAELVSVYHKELEREILWNGDKTYWNQSSPHLFPIVGKVFNHQYKVDGITYDMKQHGFLRHQDLEVIEETDSKIVFLFESNEETLAIYPYKHAVEITFTLEGKRVEVEWKVINRDDHKMYYSIGAHPGFAVDKTHDYVVEYEIDGPTQKGVLGDGYFKEFIDWKVEPLEINEETFVDDAVMYTGVEAVSLIDKTTGYRIRCDFKGFEYIAIWSTLRTGEMAPFVCIEPWRGIVDDFGGFDDISDKRGIQSIEAGEVDINTYGLEF